MMFSTGIEERHIIAVPGLEGFSKSTLTAQLKPGSRLSTSELVSLTSCRTRTKLRS